MSDAHPSQSGWYPDKETGGTKFWTGTAWSGDTRPPRRKFAAPSGGQMGWGVGLIIFGALSILTAPAQLNPAEPSATGDSPVAVFFFSLLLGAGLVALGIYFVRGQGPSTKQIMARYQPQAPPKGNQSSNQQPNQVGNYGAGGPSTVIYNIGGATDGAVAAQIQALSNPETTKALQQLQNLLYTRTITEAEYQAAKNKLLGDL